MTKKIFSQIIIFLIGAIVYPCIELVYKAGNTHWTMALVGGIALLAIIDTNLILKQKNIILRVFTATIMVTIIEFISGIIINKWCELKVWDYTNCEFNLYGQICLKFSFYWAILCLAVILFVESILFIYTKTNKNKQKK